MNHTLTESISTASSARTRLRLTVFACAAGLLSLAFIVHRSGTSGTSWFRTFVLISGSLVVSAIPFVAIGAVIAAAIATFVPLSFLEKIGRLPRAVQPAAAVLAGVALPICECGSVPIARRLMLRGVAPSTAIIFMLAAPIVNPVVMVSTYVAYRGKGPALAMVVGRFTLGAIAAVAVGWAMGRTSAHEVLRTQPGGPEAIELGAPPSRWQRFVVTAGTDMIFMGRYLLLGAAIAGLVQTFLPQRAIQGISAVPLLDTLLMMGLAGLLSLCSESDAFIATSFGALGFGASSQLAFLVFGPMVDLKLGAMYGGTFRSWVVRTIVIVAATVALVGSSWIRVGWG